MLAKIAKVERRLEKEKKGQGKILTKKQKIIGELEKVDMLGLKMEMLTSDEEDPQESDQLATPRGASSRVAQSRRSNTKSVRFSQQSNDPDKINEITDEEYNDHVAKLDPKGASQTLQSVGKIKSNLSRL